MNAWILFAGFLAVWIGFAAHGHRRGASGAFSVGGGLLVACITVSSFVLVFFGTDGHDALVFLAAIVIVPTLVVRNERVQRIVASAPRSHHLTREEDQSTIGLTEGDVLLSTVKHSLWPLLVAGLLLAILAGNVLYITWLRG